MSDKIIITNRAYVPEQHMDMERVEKRFSAPIFQDMTCRTCYWRAMRPCDSCQTCPAFEGFMHLWKRVEIKGTTYIGVPLANWAASLDRLGVPDLEVEDLRPNIPIKSGIKFVRDLFDERTPDRANQVHIVSDFMKNSEKRDYCGVILAAPRSGKTVVSLYIAIEKLKKRTLITASQIDWMEQFCTDLAFMTNMTKLAERGKTPVVLVSNKPGSRALEKLGVKVVNKWDNVPPESDIVLSTYLMMKKGPNELGDKPALAIRKHVIGKFSTLIVDEGHQTAAQVFSSFANNVDVTHRITLSATPDRKDGQSFVVYKLSGPVSAISDAPMMVPEFKLFETGISKPPEEIKGPAAYETWLAYNEERNKIILKQVFKDIEANEKHFVLIPCRRTQQVSDLVRKINQTAAWKNANEGASYKLPVAVAFVGTGDRTKLLADAKDGKYRVVVATLKIVKHGLSVPPWTHVYTGVAPISDGSGFYQLYNRVATPYDGKPQPVVRHLIDATASSVKTTINLFNSEFDSLKKALTGEPQKLKMDPKEYTRLLWIMGRPYAYFGGPEKDDQLNRRRAPRTVGGFGSKRSKDTY